MATVQKCTARLLALVSILAFISPAYGLWESVAANEILDHEQCDFRVRWDYKTFSSGVETPNSQYFHLEDSHVYTYKSNQFNTFKNDVNSRMGTLFQLRKAIEPSNQSYQTYLSDLGQHEIDFANLRVYYRSDISAPVVSFDYRKKDLQNGLVYVLNLAPAMFTLQKSCPNNELPMKLIQNVTPNITGSISNYEINRLVDGNVDNFSYSVASVAGNTLSYTLDLKRQHELGQVTILWYSPVYNATQVDVLVSDNGTNFTAAYTGITSAENIDLTGLNGRFIRLQMRNTQSQYIVIKEIEVKGR